MSLPIKRFVADLKNILQEELPGTKAQYLMAPDPKEYYNRFSTDFKKAAVLALIYPINGILHLVFMERTSDDRDKHAGQISFPGGKLEATDSSLLDCALREAHEEVGIERNRVEILGNLTKVFVFVSNFMVFPYVAYSDSRPDFVKDENEVNDIMEIPINHLMDKQNHKTKDLTIRNYLLKDVPFFDLNGRVLWGATAMMTSELIYLMKKIT